jgi:geranylgeranyl pyrophosphate synthase
VSELERFTASIRAQFEGARQKLDEMVGAITRESEFPGEFARYVDPPVRHLFQSGGKLLRPLLVLLSARAIGEISPAAEAALVRAAAAVELLHTASLAHDDMVDSSEERRGAPSLHQAFGVTTAVLVGDLFYARFFREIAALPGTSAAARMRILDSFLDVTARMCQGEILEEQLRSEGAAPSLEAYLHITETKTASLIEACCRAGALLNGGSDAAAEALARYGRDLGLLFQIADDLADGDAAFPNGALLAARADECRASAQSLLRELPGNAASATLAELPAHILSPIRT